MNTKFVSTTLLEARETLDRAIHAADTNNENMLRVSLAFTYRKLNLAWNARHLAADELHARMDQFETLCEFPDDLADDVAG